MEQELNFRSAGKVDSESKREMSACFVPALALSGLYAGDLLAQQRPARMVGA